MNKNAENLQRILERVTALLRNERRNKLIEHGLLPVQFDVLYYLASCNRYSDTLMALTEYLGQTKGTVSQTLKVLEKKALIYRSRDEKDKRIIHLQLSDEGERIVGSETTSALLTGIDETAAAALVDGLTHLLSTVQKANRSKAFGQCRNCRFNQHQENGSFFCALTQETLSSTEVTQICVEFEAP
ncbi:MarR family winged helix-turn-helix transcriptional regulator [Parasalinivibrio latis]|uniref:MarR family winged helix-turn-helix transcriptional regulator n=1 Tax=Parasalinivibrio latis TaxID=2952610 RepID=UPI0030E3587E